MTFQEKKKEKLKLSSHFDSQDDSRLVVETSAGNIEVMFDSERLRPITKMTQTCVDVRAQDV